MFCSLLGHNILIPELLQTGDHFLQRQYNAESVAHPRLHGSLCIPNMVMESCKKTFFGHRRQRPPEPISSGTSGLFGRFCGTARSFSKRAGKCSDCGYNQAVQRLTKSGEPPSPAKPPHDNAWPFLSTCFPNPTQTFSDDLLRLRDSNQNFPKPPIASTSPHHSTC